jgi:hypothetical protein
MEVLRRAYDAIGLGWWLAPTKWPILRFASDASYAWIARNAFVWPDGLAPVIPGAAVFRELSPRWLASGRTEFTVLLRHV